MDGDYDRDDLASRLREVVRRRYKDNKRAAYTAARVSPQTFDRALAGLTVKPASRALLEDFIAPPSYVSAPTDPALGDAVGALSDAELGAIVRQALIDRGILDGGRS